MTYTNDEKSAIIEMAWEDSTPFEAIKAQYDLNEPAVIIFVRKQLQHRRWRKRASGRKTKHLKIRKPSVGRAHCSTQYKLRPSNGNQRRKA